MIIPILNITLSTFGAEAIFTFSPQFPNILGIMPFARLIIAKNSTNLIPTSIILSVFSMIFYWYINWYNELSVRYISYQQIPSIWSNTKLGGQNFGYQIWFCIRLLTSPCLQGSYKHPATAPCLQWGGWGCEVSCGGHHQQRRKTIMGSSLDGAVLDFTQYCLSSTQY